MKLAFGLAAILILPTALRAQQNIDSLDPALASKITVSGFCLCRTTVANLREMDKDLADVGVEEMDLGERCSLTTDSRFINGKGYYSRSFPGMIFQRDDEDYISKIRLAKGFKGTLPDGTPVNMDSLLLKDVFKRYPYLESKWGSRDCSDYWSFSNDTVAFYVKIDTTKKPQFPIDEAYYLNKPVAGIDIFISCYSIYHKSESVALFATDEPMYFLDSIRVNAGFLKLTDPTEIAFVSVYKGKDTIDVAGKEAANGAIYVITKQFAREHYWAYFQSKSAVYGLKVPDLNAEADVVYILNGEVLPMKQEGSNNRESTLFSIGDADFIDLHVVGQDVLEKTFHVSGHSIGVVIRSRPRNRK